MHIERSDPAAPIAPPLDLPDNVAFCWFTDDPARAGERLALLTDEERLRLESFRAARRRHEFMLGRAAARTLLSSRLNVEPSSVPLHVEENGAVGVTGSRFRVSISHASNQAIAAVGMRRVGVDLESSARRSADLRRYVYHPDDEEEFGRVPLDDQSAQILCWALKEATLKARRTGLRYSPKRLRVRLDYPRGEAILYEQDGGQAWHARFVRHDSLIMAIAYEQ